MCRRTRWGIEQRPNFARRRIKQDCLQKKHALPAGLRNAFVLYPPLDARVWVVLPTFWNRIHHADDDHVSAVRRHYWGLKLHWRQETGMQFPCRPASYLKEELDFAIKDRIGRVPVPRAQVNN